MKQLKDLPRFQPDPQFLVRLDQKLHQEGKQNHHQPIWSITALVASIALLIWIFPNHRTHGYLNRLWIDLNCLFQN